MSARWHARSPGDTITALDSVIDGLTDVEASRRLVRYGPNRLAPPRPASALAILVSQLRGVIVYLLLGAVAIALLSGDRVEAAAIAAVLAINTLIGFVTELRARRAMESLVDLDVPRASVLRQGRLRVIDASDIVPGDIVELETGRQVPADGRVIAAADLELDEAPLTGESLPIAKAAGPVLPGDTPLADRTNMVYKATTVVRGVGRAVVTATGSSTEAGRIGLLVRGVKLEPTPLERRLDALGRRLVWLTIAAAALVAGMMMAQGVALAAVTKTAIALAIAAMPEALPAVATIALAVGLHRMSRRHALIRRLPVVESLGSTTVICTDKTRTLTSGQMAVVRVWAPGADVRFSSEAAASQVADPVRVVIETAALASRAQPTRMPIAQDWRGDPVDAAMVEAARGLEIDRRDWLDRHDAVGLIPFSTERRFLAMHFRLNGATIAMVKGAPSAVLHRCRQSQGPGHTDELDDERRAELLAVNERLANDGLRVLAVARGQVADASEAGLTGLTFLGFVGLADPPAPGVQETIAKLKSAGMRTVMLTGDQKLTAESVGRALGILDTKERAIDGRELDARPSADLQALIAGHNAFSRITPEHKLTIVRALQDRGDIVAMLGDGVNDAAALRQADVGVAMGLRGTDVARQAASVVLLDDRFETIAAAVEEGRVIFDNIRKFIFYLFSCNAAEVLVLVTAGIAGLPLPLLPLQLLWLNMVTDTFPALALAMEPAEDNVMRRPPRQPDEAILSREFMLSIGFYSGLITAATLSAFLWGLETAPAHASTLAFMTLAFAQTFHLGNARRRRPVLRPRAAIANWFAVAAVALSIGLQMMTVIVTPLAEVLHIASLDAREWIVAVALGATPAVVGQLIKAWRDA